MKLATYAILAALSLAAGPAAADTVQVLALRSNDLIADAGSGHLFATVPGSAGSNGNSLVEIEPLAGTVGAPIPIGSEPNRLARSDDGQYLYVGLDGTGSVCRFDLKTRTPGSQFTLGGDFSGAYLAGDIAVAPGNPNVVAVALRSTNTSPAGAGVTVFDQGVARPPAPALIRPTSIAYSADPNRLYALEYQQLERLAVSTNGIQLADTTTLFSPGYDSIRFEDGRLYHSGGFVVDAETRLPVGRFSRLSPGSLVVPDGHVGRVFFVTRDDSSGVWSLVSYNSETFVPLGALPLPELHGNPGSLVRWGADGLALRSDSGQVLIIRSDLVPPPLSPVHLEVSAQATPSTAYVDSTLSLAITFRNTGRNPASRVTLTDEVPDGFRLEAATCPTGVVTPSASIVCAEVQMLLPGESATLTLSLTALIPINAVNHVIVDCLEPQTAGSPVTLNTPMVATLPPVPDLTGQWGVVTHVLAHHSRHQLLIKGSLQIRNRGGVAAGKPFVVRVYLSPAQSVPDPSATLLLQFRVRELPPGATQDLAFHIAQAWRGGSPPWLYAVINATGTVAEDNKSNNVIEYSYPLF